MDWDWVDRCLSLLENDEELRGPETVLLRTRFGVLTGGLSPMDATAKYREVYRIAEPGTRFTFDGVKDRTRIDSYHDPFGNLTVRQRALLEVGREEQKLGDHEASNLARKQLLGEFQFSRLQELQLNAYWHEYVQQKE